MIYVAKPQQMRELDRAAIEDFGIPGMVLMERAALSVAEVIDTLEVEGAVLVLCGPGNNGGDGLALSRILLESGYDVATVLMCDSADLKGDAKSNYNILEKMDIEIYPWSPSLFERPWALIVDALLGTGLDRELKRPYVDVVNAINEAWAKVISIDIPSGISGETGSIMGAAVRADMTVTFACEKPGTLLFPGRELAGEVIIADIGIPSKLLKEIPAVHYDSGDVALLLPGRAMNSHKGNYGHVLVVGGSEGYMGAGALCALGAVRSGAGLVTWAYPMGNEAQPPLEAMTRALPAEDGAFSPEAAAMVMKSCADVDVLAIGPGMGRKAAQKMISTLIELGLSVPLIIDADGLNALSMLEELPELHDQVVLTPHPGEMARLLGTDTAQVIAQPVSCAWQLAGNTGAVVVLKMATSLIAHPDGRLCYNTTGNAGMATGGSGDVLCGMVAALLGRGMDAYDAACCATFMHGLAGDLAAERLGMESLGSSDVAAMIPAAYRLLDNI